MHLWTETTSVRDTALTLFEPSARLYLAERECAAPTARGPFLCSRGAVRGGGASSPNAKSMSMPVATNVGPPKTHDSTPEKLPSARLTHFFFRSALVCHCWLYGRYTHPALWSKVVAKPTNNRRRKYSEWRTRSSKSHPHK